MCATLVGSSPNKGRSCPTWSLRKKMQGRLKAEECTVCEGEPTPFYGSSEAQKKKTQLLTLVYFKRRIKCRVFFVLQKKRVSSKDRLSFSPPFSELCDSTYALELHIFPTLPVFDLGCLLCSWDHSPW